MEAQGRNFPQKQHLFFSLKNITSARNAFAFTLLFQKGKSTFVNPVTFALLFLKSTKLGVPFSPKKKAEMIPAEPRPGHAG